LVQSTLPSLGLPAAPITVSGCRRRTFDLSIAQTFVLLASLIYERDSAKVKEAYDLYASSERKEGDSANAMAEVESKMKELLWESEYRIRQIAESWGLHFAGVSELKSLGGPFCGKLPLVSNSKTTANTYPFSRHLLVRNSSIHCGCIQGYYSNQL
jgi:hypothetical protein